MQKITLLFLIKIISNEWRNLNVMNYTPLHYAASYNSVDVGEILISAGADVNEKDADSQNITLLFLMKII